MDFKVGDRVHWNFNRKFTGVVTHVDNPVITVDWEKGGPMVHPTNSLYVNLTPPSGIDRVLDDLEVE